MPWPSPGGPPATLGGGGPLSLHPPPPLPRPAPRIRHPGSRHKKIPPFLFFSPPSLFPSDFGLLQTWRQGAQIARVSFPCPFSLPPFCAPRASPSFSPPLCRNRPALSSPVPGVLFPPLGPPFWLPGPPRSRPRPPSVSPARARICPKRAASLPCFPSSVEGRAHSFPLLSGPACLWPPGPRRGPPPPVANLSGHGPVGPPWARARAPVPWDRPHDANACSPGSEATWAPPVDGRPPPPGKINLFFN